MTFLAFQIALTFLRKKHSRKPTFSAVAAVLGTAIGVATFLVVVSVLHEFKYRLHELILLANPHVSIYSVSEGIRSPAEFVKDLERLVVQSGVEVCEWAYFEYTEGILLKGMRSASVFVRGVDFEKSPLRYGLFKRISWMKSYQQNLTASHYSGESSQQAFSLVLGKALAEQLQVNLGDFVEFFTMSADGKRISKTLRVVGILQLGLWSYDNSLALMPFSEARALWGNDNNVRGIEISLQHPEKALDLAYFLEEKIPYTIRPWQKIDENLFAVIERDGKMVLLVVLIVGLVAAFNIITTLILNVSDRRVAIGILRSLGASKTFVWRIFVLMGLFLGGLGTLLGIFIGVMILQGLSRFDIGELRQVYHFSQIPITLSPLLIAQASLVVFALVVISSLYPAWKATSVMPLECLKNVFYFERKRFIYKDILFIVGVLLLVLGVFWLGTRSIM